MPTKFNNFIRGVVFGLSKVNCSYQDIIKTLKEDNISISKKGIYSILHDPKIKDLYKSASEKYKKKSHTKIIRTPDVLEKVSKIINNENPPTQKSIANKFNTTQTTICKIIKNDLKLKAVKKQKFIG